MGRVMRGGVVLLAVITAIAIVEPPVARAQLYFDVLACRKLEPGTQSGFFFLRYSQCGTQFTAKDPYIGLVAHLRNVREYTRVAVEILDPAQTVVWKREARYETTSGTYYPNIWIGAVLPVGADVAAIASENVRLTANIIRLADKPAVERPGEWLVRAQADRAGPRTLTFTLLSGP